MLVALYAGLNAHILRYKLVASYLYWFNQVIRDAFLNKGNNGMRDKHMADQAKGFWSSLQGIFTGIAAVITAVTGLYIAINKYSSATQSDINNVPKIVSALTSTPTPAPALNQTKDPIVKTNTIPAPPKKIIVDEYTQEKAPFPETGLLVDCTLFPTVNTVDSLISWSNYYHKQIINADGIQIRATHPCNKTIDLRGMAHCKAQDNVEVRKALLKTLTLCRTAGIEWQDIQHSTILGKE